VRPRLDHWAHLHSGRAIAVVTHGWVIRVLVAAAFAAPLDIAPRLDVRTGEVVVLDWSSPQRYELVAFCPERSSLSVV
jgi:broad specificity phosphatase PhoE